MGTVGIIPAAGNGSRWGGRVKSLLPIANDMTLIDFNIRAMVDGGAQSVVIVCNPANIGQIADMVTAHQCTHQCPTVFYAIQTLKGDMWEAMIEGMTYPADNYLFAMPDTLYNPQAFNNRPNVPFALGTFRTTMPERFGTLRQGRVVNKSMSFDDQRVFDAWGIMAWSAAVVDLWRDAGPLDYTEAINIAIDAYGLKHWDIGTYHDMATFADYQEYISHV